MKEKKQYKQYKNKFKFQCVLGLIGGACILMAVLLFVFVKFLQIKSDDSVLLSFSLYEEIRVSFNSLNLSSRYGFFALYQVIAILYIGAGVIWQIVDFFKKGIGMANLDSYSLEQYDAIKKRANDGDKRRRYQNFNSTNLLISGVIIEVICIWTAKYLIGNFSSIPDDLDSVFFKLALCNGIGGSVFFPILFLVVGVVTMIVRSVSLKNTKMAIIREEYGVDDNDDDEDDDE